MEHLPRRLAVIALAILFTLALGTTGFVVIEGYPVFDAFYMTLTTVTTVGYGEIRALSHAGRIFNSFAVPNSGFSRSRRAPVETFFRAPQRITDRRHA